jgi:DNA modification methylase
MKVQNPIVWAKSIEVDGRVRGHGQVCNTNRYLSRGWEMMWHFTHTGNEPVSLRVPYQDEWMEYNYKRTGRRDRPTTDCWHIPYETVGAWGKDTAKVKGKKKHPAVFPRELVRHCLEMCDAKSVLDPFGGTGTVGVVAAEMGIDYTLIEMDKDYCEFAEKRIASV